MTEIMAQIGARPDSMVRCTRMKNVDLRWLEIKKKYIMKTP